MSYVQPIGEPMPPLPVQEQRSPEDMTDRELLIELVIGLREARAAMTMFQSPGMAKMLTGGLASMFTPKR
jgi:hypothetical protein